MRGTSLEERKAYCERYGHSWIKPYPQSSNRHCSWCEVAESTLGGDMKFGEWQPRKGYLPALSIQQPWSWLIANGYKDIENRDWHTSYRGLVLIHAGKQLDADIINEMSGRWIQNTMPDHWKAAWEAMPERSQDYETGGIVGSATLVDVITNSTSPWFRGKYGFVLKDAKPLPFTSYRGSLGLFAVPESVLKGDEATLRAKNIPSIPPPDLDSAYELTQVIEQAEAAKQPREKPVFGDPQWIQRTRQKPAPGRCVIEVNGKRV